MPEIRHFYVIRWNRMVSMGREDCEDAPWYAYLDQLHLSPGARVVTFVSAPNAALKFGAWSEAAAAAVFIIHHVDELYEDALEVVKIDS